jgi:Phage integrase, N-terminal SAM-like domain
VGDHYRGDFVEPTRLTLGEWLDHWLAKAITPPRCSINTFTLYTHVVNKHLKPALGYASIQITLDLYAHVLPSMQARGREQASGAVTRLSARRCAVRQRLSLGC